MGRGKGIRERVIWVTVEDLGEGSIFIVKELEIFKNESMSYIYFLLLGN